MEHLDVRPLNQDVQDVLNNLGSWLAGQKFTKEKEIDNLERCVADHKELESYFKSLLRFLDFVSSRPGFSILRSTGPDPAKVLNSIGPAYIIPIQVSGSPKVSTRPAMVGEAIYITKLVHVDPKMTFVIIAP